MISWERQIMVLIGLASIGVFAIFGAVIYGIVWLYNHVDFKMLP